MANVLTRNIWECSEMGILSTGPVFIKAINFYPKAVSDTFILKWWDETQPPTLHAEKITYTNTLVSADHVVTATTSAFPSTWADGNVVKCLKTTGADSAKYGLIKTAGNNTAFTVHLIPFTVEGGKVGDWDCYPTYTAFKALQPTVTSTFQSFFYSFGGERGMGFPNLCLDTLATDAVVYIYVG